MKTPSDPGSTAPVSGRQLLALTLAATIALLWLALRADFLIDDAFISFRYARNWSEWGVPAFNPGESPPVEGYSNFAWVLLLKLGLQADVAPELSARALSLAAGVATLWMLVVFLARGLELSMLPTCVGAFALATMPPFTTWCTGGLETALFGALLLAAFLRLLGEPRRRGRRLDGVPAGALGLALALSRPEGLLWVFGLALLAWLAPLLSRSRHDGDGRRTSRFLLTSLLGFALYLLWRRSVHGEWLPNTVRAKAGLSAAVLERGADNLMSYALLFGTPLLALLAIPFAGQRTARARAAWGAGAMLLGGCAYSLAVGGDWMPMFRFLAPLSAFVAIGLALGTEALRARRGPLVSALAGSAAIALALLPSFGLSLAPRSLLESFYFRTFRKGYESEHERWQSSVRNSETFTLIGRGLATLPESPHSIALGAIGAIGYYSGWVVHDRNGLVDPEVARLPAEPGLGTAGHDRRVARSWFRSRRPDYYEVRLVPGRLSGPRDRGFAAAARELGSLVVRDGDAALLEHCTPVAHPLPAGEGLPPDTSLILLRHTDAADARLLWQQLGVLP